MLSGACDLFPLNDGSCFELRASPYITYAFQPIRSEERDFTLNEYSVNPNGEMFAVNYDTSESNHQIGQMFPEQKLFYSDVNRLSFFNGIRFLNSSLAFAADVANHRILKLHVGSDNVVTNSSNYCSDSNMIQPNDLTLPKTGTVFTSGMKWMDVTGDTGGDIWSCLPDGTAKRLELLGRTNGIELTPDEQHLYVSESYNEAGTPIVQKIWRYNVNVNDGTITSKTLLANFDSIDNTAGYDIDGMKTDLLGNLYVTRHGGAHVTIFSARGAFIGKISLSFPQPTNLEFGGDKGTTLFIVGQCTQTGKGCVDTIEVVNPGRSWSMLQASNARRTHQINNFLQIFFLILLLAYIPLLELIE